MSASSSRLQTEAFSAEKKAMAQSQARHTVTSSGMFSHKEHSSVAHSNMTISSKNLTTKSTLSSQVKLNISATNKNQCYFRIMSKQVASRAYDNHLLFKRRCK